MNSKTELLGIISLTIVGIGSLVVGYLGNADQAYIITGSCVGGVAGLLKQNTTEDVKEIP